MQEIYFSSFICVLKNPDNEHTPIKQAQMTMYSLNMIFVVYLIYVLFVLYLRSLMDVRKITTGIKHIIGLTKSGNRVDNCG